MIFFGEEETTSTGKLSGIHHKPDVYDFLAFDNHNALFLTYDRTNIQIEPERDAGYFYHILLFKPYPSKKADRRDPECFDACLIDPLIFAESVAKNGYFGYFGKRGEETDEFFDNLASDVKKHGSGNSLISSFTKLNILLPIKV